MLVNSFILFLANLCVLCSSFPRDGWPGYSYNHELQGWVKLHSDPSSWRAARISCHLEGAFLVSAWTEKFELFLKQLVYSGDESLNTNTVSALYSGFHTTSAEGAFTYSKGKPAITLDHDGLVSLERCVAYFANGTSGDVDCDTAFPYVCYVPAPAPAPTNPTNCTTPVPCPTSVPRTCPTPAPCPTSVPMTCPTPAPCPNSVPMTCPTPAPCPNSVPMTCPTPVPCPTCTPTSCPAPVTNPNEKQLKDIGYEFVNTTGHWYKFHFIAKTWDEANRTCVEEGTHLAVINTKAEADVYVALFRRYWHDVRNAVLGASMFIGVHIDSSGVWRTVDGQTLAEAGFEEWNHGFPLDGDSQGLFDSKGTLSSFHASDNYKLAFICEEA